MYIVPSATYILSSWYWAQIENPKLLYSLVMKQKSLGAFNIFVLWKKIGYLTFYGGKHINLVKY